VPSNSGAAGLQSWAASDVGRKREHNEDTYRCDDQLGLFVVADGVGGHAKGEVASAEAVDHLFSFVRQGRDAIRKYLEKPDEISFKVVRRLIESSVQSACYMVFGMAELDPTQRGMSTTISALLICDGRAVMGQVGDSRIYRMRDGACSQLTEDHTLINYKLKQGLISETEAKTMKGKNVITRAVGHKDYVEVDTRDCDVRSGDRFLLCSDGLHGYLKDGELERELDGVTDPEVPKRLIDLANERGGKDNITAVLVRVPG
jgi:protein phosphatase